MARHVLLIATSGECSGLTVPIPMSIGSPVFWGVNRLTTSTVSMWDNACTAEPQCSRSHMCGEVCASSCVSNACRHTVFSSARKHSRVRQLRGTACRRMALPRHAPRHIMRSHAAARCVARRATAVLVASGMHHTQRGTKASRHWCVLVGTSRMCADGRMVEAMGVVVGAQRA